MVNKKTKYWYKEPLRILQTVLREADGKDYDPKAVVEYMGETNSNVLVVNAGGIFDFFCNPFVTNSPVKQMGDRDILREISSACHKAGIRVIARVDFRGVTPEVFEKCPSEWFSMGLDGKPNVTQNTVLPLIAPCYNSYYRNEYAAQFIQYLLSEYDLDGIWHNALLIDSICYCDRCKHSYRKMMGKDLPIEGESSQSDMEAYWKWKATCADTNLLLMKNTVKKFGEDKVYVAEVFNLFDVTRTKRTGIDFYQIVDVFDFLVSVAFLTENAKHVHYADFDYVEILVRFLRSLSSEKQPVLLFGGNGTSHRYVMDPPLDTRIWLWEAVSLSCGFWNCVFNGIHPGVTYDRRNATIHRDAYTFLEDNSELLCDMLPYADVAVFYSKNNKDLFGSDDDFVDEYNLEIKGVENVLVESHFQHIIINEMHLTLEELSPIPLLVLPNAAAMTKAQIDVLKAYVKQGGTLIASYHTSLYDESGTKLKDFGLAELFGVSYSGRDEDTVKDCYQYIVARNHPILANIGNTEMIIAGGMTALCTAPKAGTTVVTKHVPIIINQPPEKAWRAEISSNHPIISEHSYGKGKVIYFANQIGKCIYSHGHDDFRNTLGNALRYLLGERIVLTTNAPSSVHVNLLSKKEGERTKHVISFVNLTSSFHRPVRELVPVFNIDVDVNIPNYILCKPLYQGEITWEKTDRGMTIHLARLDEFCSIEIVN